MQNPGSFSIFHFLFCELIQQCYNIHKQQNYILNLKRIGKEIGFKMFNQICLKRGISQRPQSLLILIKNIQQKIFKHLFGYQANSFYTAVNQEQKQYYYVIVDDFSIYLSWMPEKYWGTAVFFAGFIQAVMNCSGVKCQVEASTKSLNGDKIQTQFFIKIAQSQYQQWKQV